ncbi:MAG: hypothetical protein ACOZBL_02135 [Patescibacteria group bacterium]
MNKEEKAMSNICFEVECDEGTVLLEAEHVLAGILSSEKYVLRRKGGIFGPGEEIGEAKNVNGLETLIQMNFKGVRKIRVC